VERDNEVPPNGKHHKVRMAKYDSRRGPVILLLNQQTVETMQRHDEQSGMRVVHGLLPGILDEAIDNVRVLTIGLMTAAPLGHGGKWEMVVCPQPAMLRVTSPK
jgi:hypothetical protein